MIGRLGGKLPQIFSRKLSLSTLLRHRFASTEAVSSKYNYEEEVKKWKVKDHKEIPNYGWFENDPFQDEMMHKAYYFFWCTFVIGFGIPIAMYGPDWMNNDKYWRRREALMVLESRLADGKNPIDHDFVPPDQIAQMVPEEGDWERLWLGEQPSVKSPWVPNFRIFPLNMF